MANPSTAHEPSMEEILASIRQIISEDGDSAPRGDAGDRSEARAGAAEPEAPRPAMIQPTPVTMRAPEPMTAAPAAAPPERAGEPAGRTPLASGGGDVHSAPMTAAPAPKTQASRAAPRSAPPAPVAQPRPDAGSASVRAAAPETTAPDQDGYEAEGGFGAGDGGRSSDAAKLLSEDSKAAVSGAFGALAHTIFAQNARTLEDIVADMLRPMLKGWLDDNLPPLVERLVKEEIERVSRGRR